VETVFCLLRGRDPSPRVDSSDHNRHKGDLCKRRWPIDACCDGAIASLSVPSPSTSDRGSSSRIDSENPYSNVRVALHDHIGCSVDRQSQTLCQGLSPNVHKFYP
jgi:hypothetical protein